MDTNAFLTGSRAYGTPTQNSDFDLVILISKEDLESIRPKTLNPQSEDVEKDYGPIGQHGLSLRFGVLNLIACTSATRYDSWRSGTAELERRAPVTRAEAVKTFKALFDAEPTA